MRFCKEMVCVDVVIQEGSVKQSELGEEQQREIF
jgi:hypothetical protein